MKIHRHSFPLLQTSVKLRWTALLAIATFATLTLGTAAIAQQTPPTSTWPAPKLPASDLPASTTDIGNIGNRLPGNKNTGQINIGQINTGKVNTESQLPSAALAVEENDANQNAAHDLIDQVIHRLAYGRPFDAKIRQRVWTAGREMVGVGTYEQAGGGTGRFNMQVTMYDGDGQHTLQQISDGRLAWTRSVIADKIVLRKVDVGRLNEWARDVSQRENPSATYVPPKLKVGALTEMLDMIQRDYDLKMGRIKSAPLLGISGTLSSEARKRIMLEHGVKDWPELFPTRIMVAIASQSLPKTDFGQGLPVRIEFWSDPVQQADSDKEAPAEGRLISLLELYSARPIDAPPVERFRFETQDYSINIINETDRYLRRYGVRLTDSQRKQLRR